VCVCAQLKAVVEKAEQDDSSLATAPVLPLTHQVLRQVVGPLAVAPLVVATCVCGFHLSVCLCHQIACVRAFVRRRVRSWCRQGTRAPGVGKVLSLMQSVFSPPLHHHFLLALGRNSWKGWTA
jgi:hypothetical protein